MGTEREGGRETAGKTKERERETDIQFLFRLPLTPINPSRESAVTYATHRDNPRVLVSGTHGQGNLRGLGVGARNTGACKQSPLHKASPDPQIKYRKTGETLGMPLMGLRRITDRFGYGDTITQAIIINVDFAVLI